MQRRSFRHRCVAADPAMQELFAELGETHRALAAAYARFDSTVAPELIDSCIFELGAIEARYGFLLRCIKERGAKAAVNPLSEGTKLWV